MAFCRYCGKEIPEGGQCTCAESQAATGTANANASAQAPAQQNNIANDCINDFLGMFVNPAQCLEAAFNKASQVSGYVIFGIYAFIIFLGSSLWIYNSDYAEKNNFLSGIELMILMICLKVLVAAISYATKDVEGTLGKAIGTFALTTVPSIVIMLVMILPFALKAGGRYGIIYTAMASVEALYGYFAFNTMHKNNQGKSVLTYVIAQVVACVLFGIFYYFI